MSQHGVATEEHLAFGEPRARWVLLATVLGSGLAFLDATVVNVALPRIGQDLDADISGLQWTINGYTLTLAALILLGGSLGDRFGRRRIFVIGVVWFALASLACGLAPNVETLAAARAVQGVGGALLTPGSLAILQASFRPADRARAIGAWSGLGGLAGALGPFLGGWLVDNAGWRWVFLINLPFAAVVALVAVRYVPETKDPLASPSLDVPGAALGAVGLGGLTYGLIAWQEQGLGSAAVLASLVAGVAALAGFGWREHRAREPMLPLEIFSSRLFSATNLVTFAVYAALSGVFLFLVLMLQVVADFSPLAAGAALLPVTVLLLLLSARVGALATVIGPRLPMTVGPVTAGVAVYWMSRFDADTSYWRDVLPAVSLFGLGLAFTVAPLTATVLAAAPDRHAGLASGVNNAVARVGGLLAVAALPLVVGLTGAAYADPELLLPAYEKAMRASAGLLVVGGLLALATVRRPQDAEAAPPEHHFHACAVGGPAMENCPHDGPVVTTTVGREGLEEL
ncbi:MAG TPA: DHA2 family efflux MFS transporter permease subunit [Actinomycetes bacterium]|nr:DHA2 family efflux MFS transporter permease subunit [Actinomycetes bacterium]